MKKNKPEVLKSPQRKYRAKYYEYLEGFCVDEDSEILEHYNKSSPILITKEEFTCAYKAAILLLSLNERTPKLTDSNSKVIE